MSEPLQIRNNLYCNLQLAERASTAVVFVHGFGGHVLRTWLQFPILTSELCHVFPWWRECDCYFWGYPSMQQRFLMASQDLERILGEIFPSPNNLLFPSSVAMPDRRYSKLLIVGHSQGAVVVRHAIVSAVQQSKSVAASVGSSHSATVNQTKWLRHAQIRLFSPALLGASPSGLLGFLLDFSLTGLVLRPLLATFSGYQDMQPVNPFLQNLRTDTINALAGNKDIDALRARILYGKDEKIVHPGSYPDDLLEPAEDQRNHQDICKPTRKYTRPLTFVRYDEGTHDLE